MVDWRSTVTNYLADRASRNLNSAVLSLPSRVRTAAAAVSWPDFAQAWCDRYTRLCHTHNQGSNSVSVDQYHYDSLKQLIKENELEALWDDEEVLQISRIWHFLNPWPDSPSGIEELNKMGFQTCTLSSGNMSLLEDLTTHARLPFRHLFSTEHFGACKLLVRTFLGAVEKLGLKPEECAMVAAHLVDLVKADACGLQTIYIERVGEEAFTVDQVRAAKREGWVNMWVGLEEQFVGGGIREVGRLFERWKPL